MVLSVCGVGGGEGRGSERKESKGQTRQALADNTRYTSRARWQSRYMKTTRASHSRRKTSPRLTSARRSCWSSTWI